ncbi:response regulator [Methanophagales archaeon]|nr:MAG: response regulator [Methanophagales archaeon]
MEGREEGEIKILLVEDTEDDILIVERALKKGMLRSRLFVARDGEEALDFLYNRGDYADEKRYPKPDIILLDLRLPKLDGIDVLKRIRSDEKLKDIPVVVFTSSDRDVDIIKTYEDGVRGYIVKSAFIQKTVKMEGLLDAIISFIRR